MLILRKSKVMLVFAFLSLVPLGCSPSHTLGARGVPFSKPSTCRSPSGSPLDSCETEPGPPSLDPSLIEPSFESLSTNIFSFENKCTRCHDTSAPFNRSKYDFSTFSQIITYTQLFDLENPRASRFVKVLLSGEMPPRQSPLTTAEIDVIVDWISKGLPQETGGPAALVLSAPSNTPVAAPTDPTTPPENVQLCSDLVDFNDVNQKIIEPICLRCHGFATLPEFDSYDNVRNHLVKIEGSIRMDRMPPKKPLDQDLKDLLFKWIQNGSLEKIDKAGCTPATSLGFI